LPAQALLDRLVQRRDWSNTRAANAIVTNSDYTRSRIAMVYGREATVCYPGVDAAFFRPPRSRGVPDLMSPQSMGSSPPASHDGNVRRSSVISVGALEAHKGFDFVVRALARVPRDRRPRLVIIGGGGHPRMAGSLRSLAAELGVDLEVAIGVSDDELLARYQSSQLFVFGAHCEPFGMVLLEAMACGLPVVAVDEGGVRESVVEGISGLLVRRDEDAFAAAVDGLMSDQDRRLAMGDAARRLAEPRSWETATACLERHLEQVAARRTTLRAAVV
jgi:glycosyltransferase involved in cell wall biosynthesis